MLEGIDVSAVVFYVKELRRTVSFYQDTLGLPTRLIDGHEGQFAMSEAGKTLLVFFEREERPGKTPIVVFGLDSGIEDVVRSKY